MTDYRLHPDPALVTMRSAGQVISPVADLCQHPRGPRERQSLSGDTLTVLGDFGSWSYVQLAKDNYCGYMQNTAIGPQLQATHWVSARATHAYSQPDFKSADRSSLSFASRVSVQSEAASFAKTSLGYIPLQHLTPLTQTSHDPASVAGLFLGTPYLWGGNSSWGIDCSGLVQAALLACNIPSPADSDQQKSQLGWACPPGSAYMRNDLLFWKGHVALITGPDMLIHANAHHMAVTYEPIGDAVQRIARTDGPVTAHKRL
ncbi:MAG: NlpC/P60 family protein [Sulfitobacter sp.]|jgi:cell wall-associated NlpC family hydrolase|tara:strand:- start:20244 stop:21023 length:780 start_codon:yes stop_codon:yes gene_type:complete